MKVDSIPKKGTRTIGSTIDNKTPCTYKQKQEQQQQQQQQRQQQHKRQRQKQEQQQKKQKQQQQQQQKTTIETTETTTITFASGIAATTTTSFVEPPEMCLDTTVGTPSIESMICQQCNGSNTGGYKAMEYNCKLHNTVK